MELNEAFEKRENCYVQVINWIADLTALLTDKMDKNAVSSALEQLNEVVEEYKEAHLNYLALVTDTDAKDKIKSQYDALQDKITKAREDTAQYVHELENKVLDKNKDDQLESASKVSNTSKTSAMRRAAAAEKAQLLAQAEMLQQQQELDRQEQAIKHQKQQLQVRMQIAQAAAKEKVLKEAEAEEEKKSSGIVNFKNNPPQEPNPTVPNAVQQKPVEPTTIDPPPVHKATASISKLSQAESSVMEQQRQIIEALQAPKLEIPKFNGDPLKYFVFMRAFQANVESNVTSFASRLSHLLYHCTGPALTVVQGCAIMDPESGYKTAKALLAERFGNPLVIAQAWVTYITSHDHIKADDAHALQAFADLLRTCFHTLSAMNCLAEISPQSTLLQVLSKLPNYVMGRWRREVVKVKHSQARLPNFEDLVTFVATVAEEASVPIFGGPKPRHEKQEKGDKTRRPATFTTTAQQQPKQSDSQVSKPTGEKKCSYCSEAHMIWECVKFKELSVDERFKLIKEKHHCFNCLKANHGSRSCRSDRRCKINNCNRKHSYLLHGASQPSQNAHSAQLTNQLAQTETDQQSSDSAFFIETECYAGVSSSDKIALPIVPVKIYSPFGHKEIQTFALLDNCSSCTFINQQIIDELGIDGQKETLSLTTLEKSDSLFSSTVLQQLEISDINQTSFIKISTVYSRPSLPINPDNLVSPADLVGYPHLEGINVTKATSKEVGLLIGQNCPEALIPKQVITGGRLEPWASLTPLGWAVCGPIGACKVKDAPVKKVTANFLTASSTDKLIEKVEQFWKIDGAGLYSDKVGLSGNDNKVMDLWDKNARIVDGHYEIPIPFRSEDRMINNRVVAEQRLKSLDRKLERDSDLKAKYVAGINDLLENGYAEEIVEDPDRRPGRQWYLPHHAVINPNKEKIRIVFDAASKCRGHSLNSMTFSGPDLTNRLIGVLLRSRLNPICIMADIHAMFMQVLVPLHQQDALRFLWRPNSDAVKEYRLTRHIFGGTWSPAAANYALQRTAADYGEKYSSDTVAVLKRDFYVDDIMTSVCSVPQAKLLYRELKELLAKAGFDLTKWVSNNSEVLNVIPPEDRAKSVSLALDESASERALGIKWTVADDMFGYTIKVAEKAATKRGALSVLSSVYDPLGFVSPVILKARRIVQELFRLKIGWDEVMPEEMLHEWNEWLKDLPNTEAFKVPRCVKPQQFGRVTRSELHTFGDSSEYAYGACTYLRQTDEHGQVSVNLIMAKCRLAPMRKLTIVRLELAAATLAARQHSLVKEELGIEIDSDHYWSDSMIVLKYIENEDKRFHTYVANRLEIIRSLSSPKQWHHVPSTQNPADLASRGMSVIQLISNKMWVNGPAFLSRDESQWPQPPAVDPGLVTEDDPEVKKGGQVFNTTTAAISPTERLIARYSSLLKLKRAVAWVLAIKERLLSGAPDTSAGSCMLSCDQVRHAELYLVRYVQSLVFSSEVSELERHDSVKDTSPLAKLKPFLHNGIIRVGGRLSQAPDSLDNDTKHPIVLPRSHHLTELIIRDAHDRTGHSGREHVLAKCREKYWIIGARGAIRALLQKCVKCKKRDGQACIQQMADLPADRLTPADVFSVCMCDYFGPFHVRIGRRTEKRYGCLFTCQVTRAIHIEVAHSLETDSFINCLLRFTSRRGAVKTLLTDNATNFIGAERELQRQLEVWNTQHVNDQLIKNGIQWKHVPPHSSHHNGACERQIRSVRRILAGLCTEQVLTDESLSTLLTIVEGIINNRPVTTVSTDPTDLEPLTPNHLLLLKPVDTPPGVFDHDDCFARKKYRQVQYLADLFWKRWLKEYLPQLQTRSKWTKTSRNLTPGDIVLVLDNLPRNQWLMGKVLEVNKGRDGLVRSARIKTPSSELVRPITKLSLLEPVSNLNVNKEVGTMFPSEE